MWIPFFIIVVHFIADFICQTDEMAQNKSRSNKWLTIHVLTYTCVSVSGWSILLAITSDLTGVKEILLNISLFAIITFITHWGTDYVTSRINSSLWQKKKVHSFFVGLGADQVIHYGCLLFTYEYLIN